MQEFRQAYEEAHEDGYFHLVWHCGGFYPEQAALYRGACDLVVLESYVFHWGPKGLVTAHIPEPFCLLQCLQRYATGSGKDKRWTKRTDWG